MTSSEEGARFPQCMMASGVWAGASDIKKVHEVRALDNPEASVKSELMRIGYLGDVKASWEAMPMAAHFELHIGMESSPSMLQRGTDSDTIRARPNPRSIREEDRHRRRCSSKQMVHNHGSRPRQSYRGHRLRQPIGCSACIREDDTLLAPSRDGPQIACFDWSALTRAR